MAEGIVAPGGVVVRGPIRPGYEQVLTPEALELVAELTRRLRPRIRERLQARRALQRRLDAGERLDFLPGTASIREGDWKVAPLPGDLLDRRVEITGPVDRKMIINALNSGARVYMADFEDSNSPTWDNCIGGQVNLRDAVRRTIRYVHPTTGKVYELAERTATLMVRPRGLHLPEMHILVDGEPAPASLVDFGLFFYHNARELLERGTGPYFYLPKLEHHLEARIWNDAFLMAQDALGIPKGTIKATVLIETITAAFQCDEILWELRDHSAGLNCGRWDYIFSFIKRHRAHPEYVLPDRALVGMTRPFLRAYTLRVIQVCHRRGVHAMGGMAAQIPIKNDPEANAAAIAKVVADKEREVADGHDGTWVAHPGLVQVAMEVFDRGMPGPNQVHRLREDVRVTADDLLEVPEGPITEEGVRINVNVGLLYLEAWLRGNGCVPLYNLMEDAATAEISRTQLWQWIHHRARLEDGRLVTPEMFRAVLDEEAARIRAAGWPAAGPEGRLDLAIELFGGIVLDDELAEFLTLPAYQHILSLT